MTFTLFSLPFSPLFSLLPLHPSFPLSLASLNLKLFTTLCSLVSHPHRCSMEPLGFSSRKQLQYGQWSELFRNHLGLKEQLVRSCPCHILLFSFLRQLLLQVFLFCLFQFSHCIFWLFHLCIHSSFFHKLGRFQGLVQNQI